MVCKNCGVKNPDGVAACRVCGSDEWAEEVVAPVAKPDTKTCPKCGKELAIQAKFCNGCGAKQEEEPVVVEEAPAVEPTPAVEEEVAPAPVVEEPAPVVEKAPDTKTCPKCGKVLPKRVKFCTGCGAKQEGMEPATKTCPGCGKVLPKEAKFCLDCGMKQ